jgi:hypothetical protein
VNDRGAEEQKKIRLTCSYVNNVNKQHFERNGVENNGQVDLWCALLEFTEM